MCTTFELTTSHPEIGWSYVEVSIQQDMRTAAIATDTVGAKNPRGATFAIITHERGELPFSAYDRNIYTMLSPANWVSIYYSKSVTRRVNTARSPCHDGADAAWLAETLEVTEPNGTFLDFLDRQRLGIKRKRAWPNNDLPYRRDRKATDMTTNVFQQPTVIANAKTVKLFNTELLYSREACGWKVCCVKVATDCGCTCTMDWLLSTAAQKCPNLRCERTQCSDSPVLYDQCPMPCVISKFIKQNGLIVEPPDSGLSQNTSKFKLIRSENVQVAAEEEIYSLAKLFSEIGGLCSLFIGFSCIFIFELFEALLLLKHCAKPPTLHQHGVVDKPIPDYRCTSQTSETLKLNSMKTPSREQSPPAVLSNSSANNNNSISNTKPQPLLNEDAEFVTLPVVLRSGAEAGGRNGGQKDVKLTEAEMKRMKPGAYILADSQGGPGSVFILHQ